MPCFICGVKTALGLPWCLSGEEYACQAGDAGLIPGSGRSPGAGNGNPLQYSRPENSTDTGACRVTVYGIAKEGATIQRQ